MPIPHVDGPVIGLSAKVIDPRFTAGRLDGIGTYTLALERELRELRWSTRRVYAPGLADRRVVRPRTEDLSFRHSVAISVALARLIAIPTSGAKEIEGAISLYHATDYMVPGLRRTPIIATVYDAIPLAHPEWANERLRSFKNWILRTSVQRADLAIAISRAIVPEIVEHYGIPEARIRIIPLGVDSLWIQQPPAESVTTTLNSNGLERGYFLFVGTLQPRKNIRALLEAYDRLPSGVRNGRQLVIVGRSGWGVEELRRELQHRHAERRCVWLNYVDTETLRHLYAGAGAFVFPSLSEGFGLPVLEALAAGLPVVASDLPVMREVAGSLASFVSASDIDALSHAMASAVETSSMPAIVAARRERALAFDWRTCAKRTIDVYRELL